MSTSLSLSVQSRSDFGKGASRRLRKQNLLPGIVYGGGKDPVAILLEQRVLSKIRSNEAFYSAIVALEIDGKAEKVILRDLQHHPFKDIILHADFMRIRSDQEITLGVPLHFIGEEECHGVKVEGGSLSRIDVEIEIVCLPGDLPEFIEVDVTNLELGSAVHLSEIKLPEGVRSTVLSYGEDHDRAVVSVHATRAASEDEEDVTAAETEVGSDDQGDDS